MASYFNYELIFEDIIKICVKNYGFMKKNQF